MKQVLVLLTLLFIATASSSAELVFSTTTSQVNLDALEKQCQKQVTELAESAGVEIKIMQLPFRRAVRWANSGRIDGLVARTDSIEKTFPNLIKLGDECARTTLHLVTLKPNEFVFIDWANVPDNYALGNLSGAEIVLEKIEAKNKNLKLIEAGTGQQLVDMFLTGRFEMMLAPPKLIPVLESRSNNQLSVVKRNVIDIILYPYIHKKHKNLLVKLPH